MKVKRQVENICQQCDLPHPCFVAATQSANRVVQDLIHLKKGEALYRQEEKFHGIFFLKAGALKTYVLNQQGQQIVMGFYLPGDLLGFSGLSEKQYTENIEALCEAEICKVSFSMLMKQVRDDQTYQVYLLDSLSASMKQTQSDRCLYINTTAEQKVAIFLSDYAKRLMEQNGSGTDFRLLPTQQDIAAFLGLTPETVSRLFSLFQKKQVFQSFKAKQMLGLNHDKLAGIILGV